jgi:choline dehydrogenase-like flavoprotein
MKAIVVGTGAGGATSARELVRAGLDVILLEAGGQFKPFTRRIGWAESLRKTGLLGNERSLSRLFHPFDTTRTNDIVLVRGRTTGGSTTLSCGCMARAERGLREIGLDLNDEFAELEEEIGISTVPRELWSDVTLEMYEAAMELGKGPRLTPKAVDMERCLACGLCELGCKNDAKWTSNRFLDEFREGGGRLVTDATVNRVVIEAGRAIGVEMGRGRGTDRLRGDVIVLAAGGLGTPMILESSGIPTEDNLWVDYVLTLGGRREDARQIREQPMAWYLPRDRYMLSPYMDLLSHFFHKLWRPIPLDDRVGLMMKFADTPGGKVLPDGTVIKNVLEEDRELMDEGMDEAKSIMESAGVEGPFVEGMLNAGHLGGTVPLSSGDVEDMRPSHLPEGLWVSDLSLVPTSQGFPTMLTTAAISLRVSRTIVGERGISPGNA